MTYEETIQMLHAHLHKTVAVMIAVGTGMMAATIGGELVAGKQMLSGGPFHDQFPTANEVIAFGVKDPAASDDAPPLSMFCVSDVLFRSASYENGQLRIDMTAWWITVLMELPSTS